MTNSSTRQADTLFQWFADRQRYADLLVFRAQQKGCLNFNRDLAVFAKQLSSSNLTVLSVAKNCIVAKGVPEDLARTLVDLQQTGRITVGRTHGENLPLTLEPDHSDCSIHFLPASHLGHPRPIRHYKRARRVDGYVRIHPGPNPWPPEYGNTPSTNAAPATDNAAQLTI